MRPADAPRAGTQLRSPLGARFAANPRALLAALSPPATTVICPEAVLLWNPPTQSVSTERGAVHGRL